MMLIEEQVAAARQQMTGESLRAVRLRVKELSSWRSLVPSGTDTQLLLESILLQYIGNPQLSSRFSLGIAEVVPASSRLDIRFEHSASVRPALEMLPYRERGERTVHGAPGLWARVVGNSIEIAFARHPAAGVIALTTLDRSDDVEGLLSAYEASLSAQRCVPLWTVDPGTLPPEKLRTGGRRRKPQPRTIIDDHRPAVALPSALLRRIRLWDRLSGHAGLKVSAATADHGLDWHIVREVHQGVSLHDDRLAAILSDPVAGPGLVTDEEGHRCDDGRCVMEFTAPADRMSGWRSVLRVETVVSSVPVPPVPQRPRHFTALDETAFPSHGGLPHNAPAARHRSQRSRVADGDEPAAGRSTQLLAPRLSRCQWDLRGIAMQIGAAWALDGCAVLVVTHSFDADREVRRLYEHDVFGWSIPDRPNVVPSLPWRRGRLVPGSGALFTHTESGSRADVGALLQQARAHFDWAIFVDCNDDLGMGPYIERSVDSHFVVVDSSGYPESFVTAQARNGVAEHREVAVTPAASAMAWRQQHLTGIPLDRVPVSGLVLRQPSPRADSTPSPDFTEQVDAELARFGIPVLSRLPEDPAVALGDPSPTVLDAVDDASRAAYVKACTPIRLALREAERCLIPPADPWA
ncbi:hypothetical protein QQY66_33610 [Streptomyces sp. DG2A-72]|uniref:hypothetical protein n=1 Tax=Streptomyces sp. DG2A-72 TaxID=3051386 RepID=UPI00265B79C8|nr:hypothetical protein [Streptomyces sp. DG2A-72]MDO0936397.1 hypothetical protein [Streptomyces sp. DG2A-72]